MQRVGRAIQKMCIAYLKAAKSVGGQGLDNAHVNVSVVVAHECFAFKRYVMTQRVEIMIEQVLAQLRRQVGLGVEQKRSNVVLQSTFAASLVIHKKRLAVAQQNIS